MSIEQLMKSSKWSKHMIMGKKLLNQTDAVRNTVWENSLEECEKGWLTGPLSHKDVIDLVGPLYIVSPRFGLEQNDRTRPIDDMSRSFVNAAFGSSYKLDLPGIDGMAILARSFLDSVLDNGKVKIPLSNGLFLKGMLHDSLDVNMARCLVGRTLDLDSAYKQVLVSCDTLWTAILAIEDPHGRKQLFRSNVLPFGASAAVYGFNRLSRALYTIGVRLFALLWQNYYDDYPQLDLHCNGNAAQETAERLLELLGWTYSKKPAKRQPMKQVFDLLGVTFDFRRCGSHEIVITNKASRVEQVRREVEAILACGTLSAARAASLRGRLQFMESQVFGRMLSANLREFQARVVGRSPGINVHVSLQEELNWVLGFLRMDAPRVLKSQVRQSRMLVFTDAALEDSSSLATVGMVAFRMEGERCVDSFFFSDKVPEKILAMLQAKTKKVIAALELAAAVLGVVVLSSGLFGVRFFLFCDNEAARASLISLYSSVVSHNKLLKKLCEVLCRNSLFLWTARVPSASNVADAPSRLEASHLERDGFRRLDIPWHLLEAVLE